MFNFELLFFFSFAFFPSWTGNKFWCLLATKIYINIALLFFFSIFFFINPWYCHSRCQVDITALPTKQTNCLELPLEKHPGSLLMLIAVAPCTGVSISDLCVCPLGDPSERQQISQRYVSLHFFFLFFFFSPLVLKVVTIEGKKKIKKLFSHNYMSSARENYYTE